MLSGGTYLGHRKGGDGGGVGGIEEDEPGVGFFGGVLVAA